MISRDWKKVTLGEICKIASGGTPSKNNPDYWGGDIPWISASSMKGIEYKNSEAMITRDGLKAGSKLTKKNTLLLLVRGSMLWKKIPVGIAVRDLAFNQDVKSITPSVEVDSYFLLYWFLSQENKLLNMVVGTGIGAGKLDTSQLLIMELDLPPKKEQQEIVSVLKTWDTAIQKMELLIEKKQEIKKVLMQKLLNRKLRLPKFLQYDWKEIQISELGIVYTGNTPSKSNGDFYGNSYCWATAEDFKQKYIKDTIIKLSELGKKEIRLLPVGSVLVTCIASIGKNAIAATELATNQQINAIIVNKKYCNEFVYYLIQANENKLRSFAGYGSLPILNKNTFQKIKFLIPASQEEQKNIALILANMDKEIQILKDKLIKLNNQKCGLMQQLLSGSRKVGITNEVNNE